VVLAGSAVLPRLVVLAGSAVLPRLVVLAGSAVLAVGADPILAISASGVREGAPCP
jgi:hypothetical protein